MKLKVIFNNKIAKQNLFFWIDQFAPLLDESDKGIISLVGSVDKIKICEQLFQVFSLVGKFTISLSELQQLSLSHQDLEKHSVVGQ